MIRVEAVELFLVEIPLRTAFRTSFGEEGTKQAILVRVGTPDGEGWGECAAGASPRYSEEFNEAAWVVLRDHLGPTVLGSPEVEAEKVPAMLSWVRGHRMAKAALEMAVLDADLRARGLGLAGYLGAERDRVPCGVSVGIAPTIEALLEQVRGFVEQGYRRVKLKIEPGWDVEPVTAVRHAFPGIPLQVDANAAYTLDAVQVFEELDALDLLMIEQPLGHEDLRDHAVLARRLATPICLD
ncbi:MAG: o-succinylbenzoate synthase, partial [Actinobacteria bacterium]|nr:o-succinylbenzoate synthase [Actinomycetota bacterium]